MHLEFGRSKTKYHIHFGPHLGYALSAEQELMENHLAMRAQHLILAGIKSQRSRRICRAVKGNQRVITS